MFIWYAAYDPKEDDLSISSNEGHSEWKPKVGDSVPDMEEYKVFTVFDEKPENAYMNGAQLLHLDNMMCVIAAKTARAFARVKAKKARR